MANKPTLPTLVNTGNIQAQLTTINNGYRQIEDEFEKMLSREDNSLPNHMLDALDMDGHKVINVEDGTEGADAVNKSQLDTKEDYLGAPVADGMVLASTTEGERFWTSDLNVLTPTLNVAPKDAKYLVVSPHPTLTNEYSLIAGNGIAFDEGPNYLEVSTDLSEINFEDIALTGVPTAPTAAVGTNTTQVATTAFVNAEIANDAPTKTGGGASGNWNINILGNADTVDGYHVAVDEAGTNPNTIYFRTTGGTDPSAAIWGDISGSIVDQTDLYNALVNGTYATGNWNINAASVDGYNVQVDGTGTDPNTIYFKTTGGTISVDWDDVSNTPTTLAGYGITDAFTETESDARFLGINATAVNSDKVDGYNVQVDGTGTDPNTIYFKTTGGEISVDWDNVLNTPTTVAGYGITDVFTETESDARFLGISATAVNSDKVDGYHVQVDGTGTDPNTIYLKTTGGTVSVDWVDVSGTPTTIAGYGITDAYTKTQSDSNYLGATATAVNSDKIDGYHVQVDGTGTDPNTIYFKTTGGVDPSAAIWGSITGTLAAQTDLQAALDAKVPYTGATGNVNLGEYGLTTGFLQADLTPTSALEVGRMQWNDADGTMDLRLKGNNVTLQLGQEQVIRVVNKTGADLLEANYQCVRISGAQGQRPKVDLAQANNDANSADTIGIVTETITNNQEGFVTNSGMVSNINTTGSLQGETWLDGDVLYLSGTVAGRLTKVKPQAPTHTIIVGFVVYAHANNGKIFVKVDNGYEIDELHNVKINGIAGDNVLRYNSTLNVWENVAQTALSVGDANTVDGYHVQVDGTGTDPNTIYFKTTGGSIGVDWDDISNTPTTVAGYGITDAVTTSGNQTIGGTKTFSSTITGSITGNAGTVTDGVYLSGTQTITGNKTFTGSVTMGQSGGGEGGEILWNDPVQGTVATDVPASGFFRVFQASGTFKGAYIDLPNCAGGVGSLLLHSTNYNSYAPTLTGTGASGSWGISVTGNAGTVTNGVYTSGDQTIGGIKTFSTELGVPSFAGPNRFISGTGDGASLSTYNFALSGWNGMAFYNPTVGGVFPTSTTGVVNFRDGIIEMRGSLRAPIFYDSADTSYYLDPANTGTSMVVAGDVVASNLKTSANTALSLGLYTGTAFNTGGSAISLRGSTTGYNDSGMEFYAGNSERMRINSSGNVGIGTTSPGRRLSIAGGGFAFDDANVSTRSIHWGNGTTYPVLIQGDATNGFITFNTHASGSGPPERMRIDSSGKVLVGAGATASLGKLVVSEASSGTAVIALESQGSWNSQISSTSTGNMIFSNGTNERLKIDSSGNVTASVSMLAPIYYDSNNTGYYLDATSTTSLRTAGDWRSDSGSWSGEFAGKIQYHSNTWYFQATNGWIFRNASAIDVATISNAGDLTLNGQLIVNSGDGSSYIYMADTDEGARVIHCNSNRIGFLTQAGGWGSYCVDEGDWISDMSVRAPIFYDTNNTAFYVNPNDTSNINNLVMNGFIQGRSCADTNVNTANDTGSISIRGSSTTVAAMSFHRTGAYAINMGLGTDNVFRIGGWSASNNCLQMDGSGNLTMLNNVTAYSDARLKTDVVKIENALDKVQQLNGYTYTRTDTGSKQTGVIAQEVMKVLPEVVMGSEDTHYSVAYGNMVGLLIEAIKEQQGQINELKLTIEQLKGN